MNMPEKALNIGKYSVYPFKIYNKKGEIFLKKRRLITALSASMLLLGMASQASAEANDKKIKIFVDGKAVRFDDVQPSKVNNVIMVPIRNIQTYLDTEVKWDNQTKQITSIKKGDNQETKVVYNLNSNYIYHEFTYGPNKITEVEKIDSPVEQNNNRSLVPLLAATETLGYVVDWDKENDTIRITTNEDIQPIQNKNQYKFYGDYAKVNSNELDIFYLTNKEREKAGVTPLAYDTDNGEVARAKSQDMHDKEYFAHESPTYGSPFDMMDKFNVHYKSAGENIAAGFKTPEETVSGWMNSETHKENILREEFNRMGVGYYEGNNKYKRYYTQIFSSN